MDTNNLSPQMIRQRRLLLLAPLVIVPLITLFAWVSGVGKGPIKQKAATPVGVNTQLPGPQPPKNKWINKLEAYEKTGQDSIRMESRKAEDRIASIFSVKRDSNEARVYQSLNRLQAAMGSSGKQAPGYPYTRSVHPVEDRDLSATRLPGNRDAPAMEPPEPYTFRPRPIPPTPPDSETMSINAALDKLVAVQRFAKDSAAKKSARETHLSGPLPADPWIDTPAVMECTTETNGFLTTGVSITLRLQEDAILHGVTIPRNTMIYGTVALENERLHVRVRSIRSGRMIYPVSLEGYDLDGQPGIYVPGSLGRDVSKESADEALGDIDPATVDPSVGAQATSAGIRAVKSLLSQKVKQVRVFVRPGYQLLLK